MASDGGKKATREQRLAKAGDRAALRAYRGALHLLLPALRLRRRYVRDAAMRAERAGQVDVPPEYRAAPRRFWLHGASVGEITAMPPVWEALAARIPGAAAMVSALTDTGLDQARRLFGRPAAFALPADLARPLDAALDALDPHAIVIAETELWPGLLAAASRRGIPVMVVNGRLTPGSVRRYRALAPLFRPAVAGLAGIAAQSAGDRRRFIAIGARPESVAVLGSSKFDAVPWDPPPSPPAWIGGRPVLVAGSTRDGDEALLAATLGELKLRVGVHTLLVVAPRHLDRVPAVRAVFHAANLRACLRSAESGELAQMIRDAAVRGEDAVILDTLGELAGAYELGMAAIVGGGFHAPGGHNLLEPASRGRAVAFGDRQRSAAGEGPLLIAAGGGVATAADPLELAGALSPWVRDLDRAREAGRRARAAVGAARGAAGRIADFVVATLDVAQSEQSGGPAR
jgi:3-deoxy-D-manno-octulosonic-acid transferase